VKPLNFVAILCLYEPGVYDYNILTEWLPTSGYKYNEAVPHLEKFFGAEGKPLGDLAPGNCGLSAFINSIKTDT